MQLTEKIPNCNGCGACVLGCKQYCLKMVRDEEGNYRPLMNENGCNKCNNCYLYCPLYNPVTLPEFPEFFEYQEEYSQRDMPQVYRETLRKAKTGAVTDFAGTLCQIAGLKSLMGDKLKENLRIYPLHCDPDHPKRPECESCPYIAR